ncbi:MAG: hypothetical protein IKZ82_01965 [Clostridia bacterium]|nr:hypothetical protein [Clostridia bacterium]
MSQLDKLWEYQQAELELAKLNKEMHSSPNYQKRSKLQKLLREQMEVINGFESELETRNSQLASMQTQLDSLLHDYDLEKSELDVMETDEEATPEELTESKKAIEKLVGRINSLGRELNALVEGCDKLTESINTTYSKAGKAKRDYDAVRTACDEEKEVFAPKIDELNKKLDVIRANIPDELLDTYTTFKKNHASPIAILSNGQCGGCHMALPAVVEKRVQAANSIVRCENCGRILYCKQ